MLAQITSAATLGVDAYAVHVEVDLARGLPSMTVVGLPESAVREGRERVTAALHNAGFEIPPRRITINLAPADVPKRGSAFDLPIAIGILAADGVVPAAGLEDLMLVGELGLDGELRPIRGALPMALCCGEHGLRRLVLPRANAREAAAADVVEVRGAATLLDVVRFLRGEQGLTTTAAEGPACDPADPLDPDLADVRGQEIAKRALEVAAAGNHNLLMVGPPGAGKSMLARRLPGILPPLDRAEAVDVTRIHSVAGRVRPGDGLLRRRPYRAPHHSTSAAGLVGGGGVPRPGEVSLAHHGVLFLDELPEFSRAVLEVLRQPLEEGVVHLGRARATLSYPARFMMVAAMNPCPCGFHGDGVGRCTCHYGEVRRYRARISGPLLDRMDLHVDVPSLTPEELRRRSPGEASGAVRERVRAARDRQRCRFRGHPAVHANAHMDVRAVREFCGVGAGVEDLLAGAIRRLGLSARAYHRVLKVARTIADLEGVERIGRPQVAEAVQYRGFDRPPVVGGMAS